MNGVVLSANVRSVSEYRYHEFVAVDEPLTSKQMTELRTYSMRAKITRTRFQNEYYWGDLEADVEKLLLRYFDGYLYFANRGTHRLALRLPKSQIGVKTLKPFLACGISTTLSGNGKHVVVDLTSHGDGSRGESLSRGMLARLLPLREQLMRGDLRPAYLAWLLAAQQDDVDKEVTEPPVPAGLAELTFAQKAMVTFLHIDRDLIAAAIHVEAPSRGKRRRKLSSLHEYAEKRRARRARRDE